MFCPLQRFIKEPTSSSLAIKYERVKSQHALTTCLLLEMTQKNKYFRRSKVSAANFRQIVRHFALDLTDTECAALTLAAAAILQAFTRSHQKVQKLRLARFQRETLPSRGSPHLPRLRKGPRSQSERSKLL